MKKDEIPSPQYQELVLKVTGEIFKLMEKNAVDSELFKNETVGVHSHFVLNVISSMIVSLFMNMEHMQIKGAWRNYLTELNAAVHVTMETLTNPHPLND